MQDYSEFLVNKHSKVEYLGFDIDPSTIAPHAFDFQASIITWAIKLGRAALFENVGFGKTLQAAEISKQLAMHTGGKILTLAPLGVAGQSRGEYLKHSGIELVYCKSQEDVGDNQIVVTNYDRIKNFDPGQFVGVVLDESSVLKNFSGKTKNLLVDMFADTPYKICASATPAPNDYMEIGNHAEFLGVMNSNEMLAKWFINDGGKAGNYRLKKHAETDFWRWVTSWAVCITKPSDLGDEYAHEDEKFELPPLNIIGHFVPANQEAYKEAFGNGRLIPDTAPSSTQLGHVKRLSLPERIEIAKEIVADIDGNEPILIWCSLNDESEALRKAFPEAVEIRGSDSIESKERNLAAFTNGEIRILITKGSIAGHGLNWQHCNQVIDFSPNFSFETFWQQKGRNHRFGQLREVYYHIVYAETEGNVMETLQRKQEQYTKMQAKMAQAMKRDGLFRDNSMYKLQESKFKSTKGKNWEMRLGDCIELIQEVPDNSIHISAYSPPYSSIYIYGDNMADMGNSNDDAEFFQHYRYLVREMYRVTMPGRLSAIHVKDLPLYKNSGDWFGVKPFSDECVRLHLEEGWIFHSRIMIWKSPVEEMEKTNSHGLLHKNFVQRSQVNRVGLPDYVLVFVKPDPENMGTNVEHNPFNMYQYIGDNPPRNWERETRGKKPRFYKGNIEEYNNSIAVWQRYASPVWFDIRHTNVLNFEIAKGNRDERHIAPMPLDLYGRILQLWSNEGETMLEPFAGVGSGICAAMHLKRKAIGFELNENYYKYACKFAQENEDLANTRTLFDLMPEES